MKKIISTILSLLIFIPISGMSSETGKCFEKINDRIFEFKEGSLYPLEFFLKGSVLELEIDKDPKIFLRALSTFYVKIEDESLYFSLDLQEWKEFSDLFTGNVFVGIQDMDFPSQLKIGGEINIKN